MENVKLSFLHVCVNYDTYIIVEAIKNVTLYTCKQVKNSADKIALRLHLVVLENVS